MEFNFLDYTMELGENGNTINLFRFYYKDKKCVLIVPILNVKFVNYSTEAKEFPSSKGSAGEPPWENAWDGRGRCRK